MNARLATLILTTLSPLLAQSEPVRGKGSFSLYYVAEVAPQKAGGIPGKVKSAEGSWNVYRLSPQDTRKANMQGTVSVLDDDGERHLAALVNIGKWVMIPKGWEGKGNRMNPLVSYRSLAADQKHHPYGSRVFIPKAVGYITPEKRTLDGWFWVADIGGGIKGRLRFDIFVGDEAIYIDHMREEEGKWTDEVTVEHPPKLPAKYNPSTPAGVTAILEGLGYHIDTVHDAMMKSPKSWDESVALGTALSDFQRQHAHIPGVEYGTRIGAVTQWFLAQAGLAVSSGKPYPVKPGGPEE